MGRNRRWQPGIAHERGIVRYSVGGVGYENRQTTAEDLTGSLDLVLATEGTLSLAPHGQGAEWIGSAVLGESLLARRDDTWRRLKVCRNTACGVAFYDRSRNNNGVWHAVRKCGNPANLRASRARKAEETDSGR